MRLERPAPSTTAAIDCAGLHRLLARLRPRDDFHQQAADAEPGDVLARHRQTGQKPHQHPIETVFLRAARATRRAEHRTAAGMRRSSSDCRDRPACRNARRCRRSLPAPPGMTSRRSAMAEAPNTIASSAPALSTSSSALRQRCAFVRHTPLGDDRGAGGRQPLGGDLQCLVDHFGGEPRQQRRHHADLADAIRRDAQQRRRPRRRARRRARLWRRANGMIFTVAIISPATTGRNAGSVAKRDRLVDAIEPVDGVLVDDQHAGGFGEQIGAAGEGAIDMHALPRDGSGDLGGGDVFGNVARLEPRHDDFSDAGGLRAPRPRRRRSACPCAGPGCPAGSYAPRSRRAPPRPRPRRIS